MSRQQGQRVEGTASSETLPADLLKAYRDYGFRSSEGLQVLTGTRLLVLWGLLDLQVYKLREPPQVYYRDQR